MAHTIDKHIQSDIENCEGWLSPGGHSSDGRALMAKVKGPRVDSDGTYRVTLRIVKAGWP